MRLSCVAPLSTLGTARYIATAPATTPTHTHSVRVCFCICVIFWPTRTHERHTHTNTPSSGTPLVSALCIHFASYCSMRLCVFTWLCVCVSVCNFSRSSWSERGSFVGVTVATVSAAAAVRSWYYISSRVNAFEHTIQTKPDDEEEDKNEYIYKHIRFRIALVHIYRCIWWWWVAHTHTKHHPSKRTSICAQLYYTRLVAKVCQWAKDESHVAAAAAVAIATVVAVAVFRCCCADERIVSLCAARACCASYSANKKNNLRSIFMCLM